ncbi:MAG: hypothetical protein HQL51_02125 [Magnetococcales bacterium]|nr:hypothetical protein [Magnetococcales bacterium]
MAPFDLLFRNVKSAVCPTCPSGKDQRHHPLIDHQIQSWMLKALLLLQTLLVGGVMVYLYYRYRDILDQHLFRIHASAHGGPLPELARETARAVGIMMLVNVAAIVVADRLWVRYVRTVVREFSQLAQRTAAMELQEDAGVDPTIHRAVERMTRWRRVERRRALMLMSAAAGLEGMDNLDDPVQRKKVLFHLKWVRRLLPAYSRRFVISTLSPSFLDARSADQTEGAAFPGVVGAETAGTAGAGTGAAGTGAAGT